MRAIKLGDKTMSVLEIWGAEYQENDCLLIKPEARPLLEAICERERCFMQVGHCREIGGRLECGGVGLAGGLVRWFGVEAVGLPVVKVSCELRRCFGSWDGMSLRPSAVQHTNATCSTFAQRLSCR